MEFLKLARSFPLAVRRLNLSNCTRRNHTFPPINCRKGSDKNDLMDPTCKVALVTEGATSVGYGVAQQLLSQGVETVVVTSRDYSARRAAEKLCSEHGLERAVFIRADSSCPKQFKGVFKETLARLGRLDIMFNNPAIPYEKTWEHDIDVNLVNILRGSLLGVEFMSRAHGFGGRGGVVINNAGLEGLEPFSASPAHCASEHGVIGATRSLGEHFAKTGVRVLALCCGHTDKDQATAGGVVTPAQSSKAAGKAVVHLIKRGAPGSIWVLDSGELFVAQIPHRSNMSQLVTKYV